MRSRWLAALAAALLSAGLAGAQPKAPQPTAELRLRSVSDLVDRFEYVAGLVGQDDVARQVRDLIKGLGADGKGVEGIDPNKPLGAYATLEQDVATSPFVVLIPITDRDQFLKALKTRLDATTEKGESGTLRAAVPLVGEVHFRFDGGYLFVSQRARDLDPKALVPPKVFFANDDGAAASLVLHVDRVPADLRAFLYGQFELGINDDRKKNADNETAAEKRLKNLVLDTVLAGLKGLTDDGKQLAVKLFVDPKADEITAEVTLSAAAGSPTARNFAALGKKTSLPAGIVGGGATPAGAAARGSARLGVTDGTKKEFAAAVEALLAEAVKNAPDDQGKDVLKALVAAVGPTLKAGEVDLAGALHGPDAKGHYAVLGALAVTDGKGIEKFVKTTAADFGALIADAVEFKFDVQKVGPFALHQVVLKRTDDKFEKVFGAKPSVWLAVSDACVALSIEPDGALIKTGLKAKAVSVPALSGEVAAAKVVPLLQPDIKPDELKALLKDAFGDGSPAGKDTVTLSVAGGDKLTIALKAKGKAVRAGTGLGQLR